MQEHRLHPRTRIAKAAQLFGTAHLEDCIVHDISAAGARLTMASTRSIPDTFDLSFDGARTLRPCRVVWRTAGEIGLQFEGDVFRRRSSAGVDVFASSRRFVRAATRRRPTLVSGRNKA